MNGVQHAQPFKVIYTNDWNTYYSGKNIPNLNVKVMISTKPWLLPAKPRMVFLIPPGVTLILIHFLSLTPIR